MNSALPSVKLVSIIYKKLNLEPTWGEHCSESLLELHLSVSLGSSALDLNLAKNYIWTFFPLSLEILLFVLGLKDKAPLFLVVSGHQFLSTHSYCS